MSRIEVPRDLTETRELFHRYRRWGRWGPDDELGALNLIGPEQRRHAATLARTGKSFSLSIPVDENGPMTGVLGRTNPSHLMLQDGGDIANGSQEHLHMQYTDDALYLVLQSGTQWDALAHFFFEGHTWNGYGPETVTSRGALRNGIDKVAGRFYGRGVLLDLPRHHGVDMLDPSTPIHGDDLLACAERQGVELRTGDIALIRTGDLARARARGSWGDYCGGPCPGLSVTTTPVFAEWDVAAIATDTWTVEVWPSEVPKVHAVMHDLLMVGMGVTLGEIFDLEELAADCAQDGVYEFLLCAPPLRVTGGVGSPVNPMALK